MTELRRHARTPLGHAVDFATKGLDFALRMDGVANDISLGGMFILTDFPTRIGEDLIVYLTLPGGKYEMALPAIVRWTRDDGMGVQFGQLGARDTHAIVEFTEHIVSGSLTAKR
jgi:type IV pilus assembly protein PilZ